VLGAALEVLGEPVSRRDYTAPMSDHEQWIAIVDREGVVALVADGPYTRYGWPVHVTVRQSDGRYRVNWVNEDDGAGASGEKDLDRAGLERFLDELLQDSRPVQRLGG
jgi:hypothetical protein